MKLDYVEFSGETAPIPKFIRYLVNQLIRIHKHTDHMLKI